LYAFVTQTIRGEVAIVDLTKGEVVDLSKSRPGFGFVPVGAVPTDIVATPGGTAVFVGSAESGREAIWVLPSRTIVQTDPSLTSFAACALQYPPKEMKLVVEPTRASQDLPPDLPSDPPSDPTQSSVPAKCNGEPYEDLEHLQGDLSLERGVAGTLKLIVSFPDAGALGVIDAQGLIDQPPGSLRACQIERWVPLQVSLPPSLPLQRVPEGGFPLGVGVDGGVCEFTARTEVPTRSGYVSRPSGMAYDSSTGKLYVADEDAPVIHVVDASSPCEMTELSPLLPMSASRPERDVRSRAVAVSPVTSSGKKYLYATDFFDGSVMVFDVSLLSSDRTPLMRPNAWRNPFQPLDRLTFSVPVRGIEFVLRDLPATDPSSGATAVGIGCDPSDDGSIGARYRTSSDFSQGARPRNLRGVFAALALLNGEIAIIDVDDFDASCRRPHELGACDGETFSSYHGASGELSCNMVQEHQPRSAYFIHMGDDSGGRAPGLQSYPTLSLGSTVLPTDQSLEGKQNPRLLAPGAPGVRLSVGGREVDEILTDPSTADKSMVLFDVRAPRVHSVQDWAVVFEGNIPGFDGHVGRFDPVADDQGRVAFYDSGAFFCDRGVHDLQASGVTGVELGLAEAGDESWAREHGDVLQITSDYLDEKDGYWGSVGDQCSWLRCRETFGVVRDPKSTRDLAIVEAYQGKLVVDAGGLFDYMRCCFPSMASYTVRAKNHWVVKGAYSGFMHRVVPDFSTGRCVDTCDPNKRLFNARAFERVVGDSVPEFDGPGVFRNPALQFVVWRGESESQRDMAFMFRQNEGFTPLMVNLAASTRYVQPQSMGLAPTGELAIADGAAQGLIFVDLGSLGVSRSYY